MCTPFPARLAEVAFRIRKLDRINRMYRMKNGNVLILFILLILSKNIEALVSNGHGGLPQVINAWNSIGVKPEWRLIKV